MLKEILSCSNLQRAFVSVMSSYPLYYIIMASKIMMT